MKESYKIRNYLIKYGILLNLIILCLYFITGCKWKHAFRNESYQEIIILGNKEKDGETYRKRLTKEDIKRIDEIMKQDMETIK